MCFEKYRRNIFKWGLVLKVSSKEIQLCNRNLNMMDDLRTTIFLVLKLLARVTVPHGGGGSLGPRDPKAATWARLD